MNYNRINQSLQNIITRLKDAENGYLKIAEKIDDARYKHYMFKHSRKRHHMYKELLSFSFSYAQEVNVKGSALGAAHRLFIDISMIIGQTDKFYDYIYQEIERGSNELLYEYDEMLKINDLPIPLINQLQNHKDQIKYEIEELNELSVPV